MWLLLSTAAVNGSDHIANGRTLPTQITPSLIHTEYPAGVSLRYYPMHQPNYILVFTI